MKEAYAVMVFRGHSDQDESKTPYISSSIPSGTIPPKTKPNPHKSKEKIDIYSLNYYKDILKNDECDTPKPLPTSTGNIKIDESFNARFWRRERSMSSGSK
jgi:hypothetical protein